MACTLHPTDEPVPPPGRAMTRCECTGISFAEAARNLTAEGMGLDELPRRTGCGGNCSACLPDLLRYLASIAPR
jgi:bacterioferritin-associated ferredoxin